MNVANKPDSPRLRHSPPGWPDLAALIVLALTPLAVAGMVVTRVPARAGLAIAVQLPVLALAVAALVRFVGWEWRRPASGGVPQDSPRRATALAPRAAALLYGFEALLALYIFAYTFGDVVVWLTRGTAYLMHRPISQMGLLPMSAGGGMVVVVLMLNVGLLSENRWATLLARVWIGVAATFPAVAMLMRLTDRLMVERLHHLPWTSAFFLGGCALLALAAKAWIWAQYFAFARLARC
ncbi:MAG TPA: hypothetical protein VGM37_08670 [Armatimonadota bacterium]